MIEIVPLGPSCGVDCLLPRCRGRAGRRPAGGLASAAPSAKPPLPTLPAQHPAATSSARPATPPPAPKPPSAAAAKKPAAPVAKATRPGGKPVARTVPGTRAGDAAGRRQVAGGPTADEIALGAETPELRALRQVELELFPPAIPPLGHPVAERAGVAAQREPKGSRTCTRRVSRRARRRAPPRSPKGARPVVAHAASAPGPARPLGRPPRALPRVLQGRPAAVVQLIAFWMQALRALPRGPPSLAPEEGAARGPLLGPDGRERLRPDRPLARGRGGALAAHGRHGAPLRAVHRPLGRPANQRAPSRPRRRSRC